MEEGHAGYSGCDLVAGDVLALRTRSLIGDDL